MNAQAPVVEQTNGFVAPIETPAEIKPGDQPGDLARSQCGTLERWIKEHPEQWVWVDRRWVHEEI